MKTILLTVLLCTCLAPVSGQHVRVTDGTHFTLGNDLVLRVDSLVVRPGGNLFLGPGAVVHARGSFDNQGNFTAGTGSTVNFDAAATQYLSGPTTFSHLTKSGGGTLVLGSSLTVNGVLTLSSGMIELASNTLTIGASGSITGASPASYIITNGTGTLTRNSVGTSPVLFPIGTALSYNPATIRTESGSDNFAVRVLASIAPPSPNDPAAVQRSWDIAEQTPGGNGNLTLTFQWNATEEGPSFERSGATSWRHNGTAWVEEGLLTGITGANPYVATIEQVTGAGRYAVANPGALPIQLASFTGRVTGRGAVLLEWITLSELNNYGFFVQRRADTDTLFLDLPHGFVPGHGTTLEPQYYSFLDTTLSSPGLHHYRLRQVDLNGTVHYTSSITIDYTVSVTDAGAIPHTFDLSQNYPNPFNPSTAIHYSLPHESHVRLTIYTVIGQEVVTLVDAEQPAGYHAVRWDGTNAQGARVGSGVYLYRWEARATSGNRIFVQTRKMVLMK